MLQLEVPAALPMRRVALNASRSYPGFRQHAFPDLLRVRSTARAWRWVTHLSWCLG